MVTPMVFVRLVSLSLPSSVDPFPLALGTVRPVRLLGVRDCSALLFWYLSYSAIHQTKESILVQRIGLGHPKTPKSTKVLVFPVFFNTGPLVVFVNTRCFVNTRSSTCGVW